MREFYYNKYVAVVNKEKTIGTSECITEVINESVENEWFHKRLL